MSLGEATTQAAAAAVTALGDGGLRATDRLSIYTRACTLKVRRVRSRGRRRVWDWRSPVDFRGADWDRRRDARTLGFAGVCGVCDAGTGRPPGGHRGKQPQRDGAGRYTEREVWRDAGSSAITILGVMAPDRRDPELALETLCASLGGTMLASRPEQYPETLKRVLAMVRGRYIVEFPRASNATAGLHDIRVAIEQGENLVVRSSGTTVPLPSAMEIADPTTIPNDASRTPTVGSRRSMESRSR